MTAWLFTQYQIRSEPPSITAINDGIAKYESSFHQPWSEPSALKQTIKPVLAIALIASGLFAPVLSEGQITDRLESRWHQPWSEPVRQSIDPKLAIALAASGPMAPVLDATQLPGQSYIPWFASLSEPVRLPPRLQTGLEQFQAFPGAKPEVSFAYYNWLSEPVRLPVGIAYYLQRDFTGDTQLVPPAANIIGWFIPLADPVRLPVGLKAWLQRDFTIDTEFIPQEFEGAWYVPLSEPVRLPIGLRAWLQHYWEGPNRLLPPVDITATMAATETNTDTALFGIYVTATPVTPSAGATTANVSISEIPVENNAAASLRES